MPRTNSIVKKPVPGDYELLHNNIGSRIQLNDEELAFFDSLLSNKKLLKKSILLAAGEPCKYFYYVDCGALRAYTKDSQGKEATIMFALTDWWITDMYCFLNEKPAMMFIEAIEDSQIFQISKKQIDVLLLQVPKFEKFFRLLMQSAYTREQLRVIETLTLTAESRYNTFITKYPKVASAVTLKQIASYLGITPEFLSAIRSKVKNIS